MLKPNYTGHRKDVEMLENYFNIFKRMNWPRNIIEFGVDQGGSMLFFNDLFAPELYIGLDFRFPNKKFYDISADFPFQIIWFDQMDTESIQKAKELVKFHALKFDLMIDDCCHNGHAMENTLRIFWDLLSKGGMYIIEDWPAEANSIEFYERSGAIAKELKAKIFKSSTLIAFKK